MKQLVKLSVLLMLMTALVFLAPGCGGEKATSDAKEDSNGTTETVKTEAPGKSDVNVLSLLPQEATGIAAINFEKFAEMEFFDKMLEENKDAVKDPEAPFKSYRDFVEKTGIDLKKDVHEMAFAFVGSIAGVAGNEPQMVAVLKIDYDKNTVEGVLKGFAKEVVQEEYNGITIFTAKGKKEGDKAIFALLDDGLAVGGNDGDLVKKSIDLFKGTGKSVLDNELLMSNYKNLKSDVLVNMVAEFPAEGKTSSGGAMPIDLSKALAITGTFDYDNKTVKGEMQIITSPNPEGNPQIAGTLNGLKMMAASGGQEFMELVNNINFTATDTSVKMSVSLTEELIAKLQAKMNEKKEQVGTLPGDQQ